MAIHRGVQSAIFWYASCAPCTERRHAKERKREIEQGRRDREMIASQMPDYYRHPDPTDTNPHWQHEIDIGPVLVGRRWKGYSEDPRKKTSRTIQRSNGSNPSSPELRPAVESRDGMNDSKIDFKKYQRDDDELWGSSSTERLGHPRSWQSEGVTMPPRAHTRGSDTSSQYTSPRNPPLNDLHPATVTKINTRADARWIFQPLPTADVMLGKTRAPRSRSDSGNSSRASAKGSVPLSREISHKMLEQKLRSRGESLRSTMSKDSEAAHAAGVTTKENDGYTTSERDFAADANAALINPESHTPAAVEHSEGSNESAATVVQSPGSQSEELETATERKTASRPRLSTIVSDDVTSSSLNSAPSNDSHVSKENGSPRPLSSGQSNLTPAERDRLSRRSALLAKDDSLRVLQELAPSSRIFKTQVISPDDLLVRASKKSGPRLPSQDRTMGRDMPAEMDPELFEAWDTADFALPEWIHEHTKREVKERWSMDI